MTLLESGVPEPDCSLVLVSGLSGSGKSIALKVLEDAGYYCVDNLPATLLLEVVDFLRDAGHERVAVSVDARSAALAALPEHIARAARSAASSAACCTSKPARRACCAASPRRAGAIRSRGAADAAGGDRARAQPARRRRDARPAHRHERPAAARAAELDPRPARPAARRAHAALRVLRLSSDGIPLDADWVFDARMLAQPALRPAAASAHRPRCAGHRVPRARDARCSAGSRTCAACSRAGCPRSCARTAASVTVAIGCTGGRHRSVYLAEQLAAALPHGLAGAGAPPRPGRNARRCLAASEICRSSRCTPCSFPGGRLPLRIFEQRYMDMAKACLRDERALRRVPHPRRTGSRRAGGAGRRRLPRAHRRMGHAAAGRPAGERAGRAALSHPRAARAGRRPGARVASSCCRKATTRRCPKPLARCASCSSA